MNQRNTSSRFHAGADRVPGRGVLATIATLTGAAVSASLRAAARRPAVMLASIAVFGGAGVFAWNATMKQTAQHPAPLFATPKPPAGKPEAPRRADVAAPLTTGTTRTDAPMPPPRPAGPDGIASILRSSEAAAKPGERAAEAKPKLAEKPKAADAKSADVKRAADAKAGDAKKSAEKTAAGDAKPVPQPRVASAQRALAKLGYGPIAADGLLGSTTRQAIEKFEREKNLPVTGAVQGKTAKKLASLSGISIE